MPSQPRIPTPPSSSTTLRAKPLRSPLRDAVRTERPRVLGDAGRTPYASAWLFGLAMTEWGGSNAELARWLDVSETVVRAIRSGEKMLSVERVLAMPDSLRVIIGRLVQEGKRHVG